MSSISFQAPHTITNSPIHTPAIMQHTLPTPLVPTPHAPLSITHTTLHPIHHTVPSQPQAAGRWDLLPMEGGPRPLQVTVRRDHLLEDAWAALRDRGPALKGRLVVSGKGD